MAISDIDFEGNGGQGQEPNPENKPSNGNDTVINQEDVTNLNGGDTDDITSKSNDNKGSDKGDGKDITDDNPSTGGLSVGDSIEFDGTQYTVAENGDIVDADGNVFKEAKDVETWLKSVEVDDNDKADSLDIASIQEALGVEITNDNGETVEFTNDAAGVKSYVDAVLDLRSQELQEAAINRLYSDNPLLKQFQDYVQLTGTAKGFGDIPDRSGIELDKDNESQLVAVIKMAASEFGNKSLNDNYIKYLHDTGGLYDEAKNQLNNLIEKDKLYRETIETKAAEQREAERQNVENYFKSIKNAIDSRVIGGYKLPESFTKEVNGKKVIFTPNDFYDYISRPVKDADGNMSTGYQRDLNNLSDEDYLNRELLDAWLMLTGGSYKDLIDMAVKEDKVRQLKIKSKEMRTTKSVKIIKKTSGKAKIDDIIL